WEWEPSLLGARRELEQDLDRALVEMVGARCPVEEGRGADPAGAVERALLELQARPGPSLSSFVLAGGTLEQVRELAVHRSAYQLKEADPHTWAIPRLAGRSKAALVDIQFGEYGDGDPARVHAELFARTLRALDLDDRVGAYVDRLPGVSLSTCNLISLFGLHRRWRGALVGHLALFELCSVVPMGRYRDALVALGYGPDATEFYAAHVEADARHQEVALREMVAGLVADEPDLAADVVFGARSLSALEGRFADHVLRAWRSGRSSLRQPLRAASHRQGSNGGGLAETMLGSH
ncbi:MAG: iron-containing redox enzyme family protein, partial [Acidimicrobiia bacterium]